MIALYKPKPCVVFDFKITPGYYIPAQGRKGEWVPQQIEKIPKYTGTLYGFAQESHNGEEIVVAVVGKPDGMFETPDVSCIQIVSSDATLDLARVQTQKTEQPV